MNDPTEAYRRARVAELNTAAAERAQLEQEYGAVYDTQQLQAKYQVLGFAAPFVVVRDRETGQRGSLEFQHDPRFYFNFQSE